MPERPSMLPVDTDDAYVAVHSCGCMTAWISDMGGDKEVAKFCAEKIRKGMTVRRVNTGAVKADPLFAPIECPHDPKGWEPWKPQSYEPKFKRGSATSRRLGTEPIRRLRVQTPWHHPYSMGDLVKHEGKWLYTDGWFDQHAPTAHYSDDSAEVFTFDTKAEAQAFVLERAMRLSREAWITYGTHTEKDADKMLAYAEGRF